MALGFPSQSCNNTRKPWVLAFISIFCFIVSVYYCSCGNSYGKYGCESGVIFSSCNVSCPGNSLEICGGQILLNSYNSIYAVG